MSRFFVPPENIKRNEIIVKGAEARHIAVVMRLEASDKIVVFDGTGAEYTGFIKEVNKKAKKIIIEIVSTKRPFTGTLPEIVLAQAIPKKEKMDYIVEKAVELGVSRIIPVISKRTIVRPDKASGRKKTERWRKIAVAAAKQCGGMSVPKIDGITEYYEIVQHMDEYDLVLFACLNEDTISLKKAISSFSAGKILVFIGPEGDFAPEEILMAGRDNTRFVSLGRRVLKSDTAGVFVLSILSYEFSL